MEQKPGYKTSEFWVTALTAIFTLINQSGALHFVLPADTVVNVVHAVMTYVASRSLVKAAAAYAGTLNTQAPTTNS